jgi:hypothetical protein
MSANHTSPNLGEDLIVNTSLDNFLDINIIYHFFKGDIHDQRYSNQRAL